MKTPLSAPDFSGIRQEQLLEVLKNCEKGKGDEVLHHFESDFGKIINSKYVVALSSATASIHLALIALGVSEGDVVLCPTFTFAASAFPIIHQKAIPCFVDSETETWNISPIYLEKAIKDCLLKGILPKAIIVVHSYGNPAKLKELLAVSEKYKIPLIEDAANALGSTYSGKQVGTFGKIGVFSFNRNKIISAAGGGCLVTDDEKIAKKVRYYAHQAKSNTPYYHHEAIGYNYGLSPILAEIVRLQLPYLPERLKDRLQIRTEYKELFQYGVHFQEECKTANANNWLNAILIDSKTDKSDIEALAHKSNIEIRSVWKPMHLQPAFDSPLYVGQKESELFFQKALCLPYSNKLFKAQQIEA